MMIPGPCYLWVTANYDLILSIVFWLFSHFLIFLLISWLSHQLPKIWEFLLYWQLESKFAENIVEWDWELSFMFFMFSFICYAFSFCLNYSFIHSLSQETFIEFILNSAIWFALKGSINTKDWTSAKYQYEVLYLIWTTQNINIVS